MSVVVGQTPVLYPSPSETPLLIDGFPNEPAWQDAQEAANFRMHFPFDSLDAVSKTSVRVLYDKKFLYISAICRHQHEDKSYIVQSLKRDFDFGENDAFGIYINTINDQTNGLYFGVNPFGVQSDGIIDDGGIKGVELNWDGLWMAEVQKGTKAWSVEIAIPLKTIRFKSNQSQWRINFARNDRVQNEISSWAPIPRGYKLSVLSRAGILQWEKPPEQPISNISVIPHFSVGSTKDFENPAKSQKVWQITGLDAKVAVNSSLNLDLAINPDFSQVEVDQQVIDLQRFEIFFPERRLLFLENSDLFANLGNSRIRPFFSRRIGNTNSTPVPILFGARLSGNLDNNWRLGIMSIQTKEDQELDSPSNNYSVATIQRKLFNNSSLTGFLMNRQSVQDYYLFQHDYNRVAGIEYDLRSKDAKWNGKAFFHRAFTPQNFKNANAYSAKLRYRSSAATLFLGVDHTDKNYITDIGFVPRLYHSDELTDSTIRVGYTHFRINGHYRFFAKKNSLIDFWGPTFHSDFYINAQAKYQEHRNEITFLLRLKNTSSFELLYSAGSPMLLFPFTLKGLNFPFPAGNYLEKTFELHYDTGKRNRFFGEVNLSYGNKFLGNRFQVQTNWNYRYKHYAVLGINLEYDQLVHFPEAYGEASFTWIGSKFEISFNRNLFFTTFIQYNTQKNNFNINSKLNWRFKPMSDLFIVYTENYTTQNLSVRNRALVLKLDYWIGGQ